MKKYPVMISGLNGSCKRSLTMSQIEVLFIVAEQATIIHHKRKNFDLLMAFYGGEFKKAVTVIKLPNGYLPKFKINKP